MQNEWDRIIKDQIKALNADDDLSVEVVAHKPPSTPAPQGDHKAIFLNRSRQREAPRVIDLDGHNQSSGVSGLPEPAKPPPKAAFPLKGHG
jgi:hypothetical protein